MATAVHVKNALIVAMAVYVRIKNQALRLALYYVLNSSTDRPFDIFHNLRKFKIKL